MSDGTDRARQAMKILSALGLSFVLSAASFASARAAFAGDLDAEIANPKRDLEIETIKLSVGLDNQPVFDQKAGGWMVDIVVTNNGDFDESVLPPSVTIDGVTRALKPGTSAARRVAAKGKTVWTLYIPPGTGGQTDIKAVLQGLPATQKGVSLSQPLALPLDPTTADLQVVLKNPTVTAAGGTFALSGDVVVYNHGAAPARRYKLKYGITTANGAVDSSSEVTGQTVQAKSSIALASRAIFTNLSRDPAKNTDTVTATVQLEDDGGQALKDADPTNDTFTLKLGGSAALEAAAVSPDLTVTLSNPSVASAAGGKFALSGDVKVQNLGGVKAYRYGLKYAITTADGAVENTAAVVSPLQAGGSTSSSQQIFPALARDPVKNGDTVTATVVLQDDNGQAVQDADPANDAFTLKLTPPEPPRDISISDVALVKADPSKGVQPAVTVTVVNNGPNMEPKIAVSLVPTGDYPASLLKAQEIANLAGRGKTAAVTFQIPLLNEPTTFKFRAQLSVDPADPSLKHLRSDEKSLDLPSGWIVGRISPLDLTKYFDTPYVSTDPFGKAKVLVDLMGGGQQYTIQAWIAYLGGEAPTANHKATVSGLGSPQTSPALDLSAATSFGTAKFWTQTFAFDLPNTDDATIAFRVGVIEADGKELNSLSSPGKVPGLQDSYFKRFQPPKHDLRLAAFGLNPSSGQDGNAASAGPLPVNLSVYDNGTVDETAAKVKFTLDGADLYTGTLPEVDVSATTNVNFNLPWKPGKKLKAELVPDGDEQTPSDNTQEIAMPDRDLGVTDVSLYADSDGKPKYYQEKGGWAVNVAVGNLGGFSELVAPPFVTADGSQLLAADGPAPRRIPAGGKETWTYYVPPGAGNSSKVVAAVIVTDSNGANDVLKKTLQFPPKPPRLDLGIQSVAAQPDKIDYVTRTIPVAVTVANVGEGETAPLKVFLKGSDGTTYGPQSLPRLGKGEQATVTIPLPLKDSAQSFTAYLDVNDVSLDADPTNNQMDAAAPPMPWDLSVGDVTLGDVDSANCRIAVRVKVTNAGSSLVRGRQIGVKLGGNEYVSDAASSPDIAPGKSADYVVSVPLAVTGGPATVVALVEGSLDGELTPRDDKKVVTLTFPDKPLWDLAVTNIVLAQDPALADYYAAYGGGQVPVVDLAKSLAPVQVTVTNMGVITMNAPTVLLSVGNLQMRQKVSAKIAPGQTADVTFPVSLSHFSATPQSVAVKASLDGQNDDNPQDDSMQVQGTFSARAISISDIKLRQIVLTGVNQARAAVDVTVKNVSAYTDPGFNLWIDPKNKTAVGRLSSGDSTAIEYWIDVKPGDAPKVTASLDLVGNADPGGNSKTVAFNIPNPLISAKVYVHDPTPAAACFIIFPKVAPQVSADGITVSLDGYGTTLEGPAATAPGWDMNAHLFEPPSFVQPGPWTFHLKLKQNGAVVLDQNAAVPVVSYDQAKNAAVAAMRDYRVASVTGPTAADAAVAVGAGKRTVPVSVALEKVAGTAFVGGINVHVAEVGGAGFVRDYGVTVWPDGKGSQPFELPLLPVKASRTLTVSMKDFADSDPTNDSLTITLPDLPAGPFHNVAVSAISAGDAQNGNVPVLVAVWNLGNQKETGIKVRLALDGIPQGSDQTVASLDPGVFNVLSWQVPKPSDRLNHTLTGSMVGYSDDLPSDNSKSIPLKLGWDYKVTSLQIPAEPQGQTIPLTIRIDKVAGTYAPDQIKLKVKLTDPDTTLDAVATPADSGSYQATVAVPLIDYQQQRGVEADMVDYGDDDPSNNSKAVNLTFPAIPYVDVAAREMKISGGGVVRDLTVPILNAGDVTEKNIKIRLLMDGHQLEPDQTIASIAPNATANALFHVPARVAGTYKLEASVLDHPDAVPANNTSLLTLSVANDPTPYTKFAGVVSGAAPTRGSQVAIACKDLPDGNVIKGAIVTKDPYLLKDPSYKLIGDESVKYVKQSPPEVKKSFAEKLNGTLEAWADPESIAMNVIGATSQAIQGQQITAFGIGEWKDDEPKDSGEPEVLYVVDTITFGLAADMPAGVYTAIIWIDGKENTRCVADINVH